MIATAAPPFHLQTGEEEWDRSVPHLEPHEGLWTILRRPVFAVGEWNGDDYDEQFLAEQEEWFPHYVRDARPWVTLNHAPIHQVADFVEEDERPKQTLAAVLGNISRIYRNTEPFSTAYGGTFPPGHLMLADFVNVPDKLKKAIERGNFPRPSIGLEPDFEGRDGRVFPWILQHVSFQGAEPEAVFTLDDLDRLYGRRQSPRVLQFFRDESRAARGRKAPSKILTFQLGEPKMEERIANIEAALSQLMETVANLAAKLEGPKEDSEAPEAEMSDAEKKEMEDKEEEEFSEAGAAVAEAPAPVEAPEGEAAPSSDSAPSSNGGSSELAGDIASLREELAKKDAMLTRLEERFEALDLEKQEKEKEYRRRELKQFVASRKSKIPALLQPLAESILEGVADLEARQKGGKVKTYSREGKDLGLTDSLKLFMDSMRPIQSALGGPVLSDLEAPGATPTEWNKETVAKEVKEFAKRHKMDPVKDYSKAFKQCAKIHGQEFIRGLGKQPESA